jgi:hypothetical protein
MARKVEVEVGGMRTFDCERNRRGRGHVLAQKSNPRVKANSNQNVNGMKLGKGRSLKYWILDRHLRNEHEAAPCAYSMGKARAANGSGLNWRMPVNFQEKCQVLSLATGDNLCLEDVLLMKRKRKRKRKDDWHLMPNCVI